MYTSVQIVKLRTEGIFFTSPEGYAPHYRQLRAGFLNVIYTIYYHSKYFFLLKKR